MYHQRLGKRLFSGTSELATLMRSRDWTQTSLGSVKSWPLPLENSLNILLNATTPMFCVWGPDRLLFCNDACSSLWSTEEDPLDRWRSLGQPLKNNATLTGKTVSASISDFVEKVFAEGLPIRQEPVLPSQDSRGVSQQGAWDYTPLWNEAGQIGGVFATGSQTREILSPTFSDTRGTETTSEKVEHSEPNNNLDPLKKELRIVNKELPVLVSFVDSEQRYCFHNPIYETWFGSSAKDTYGKHLKEILGESAYTAIRPDVEQALAGHTVTSEHHVTYPHGGVCDIQAIYVPQFDLQGTVTGFIALVIDMGKQKRDEAKRQRAEAALRESEALKQSILDSSTDCIKVLSLNGEILYINTGGLGNLEIEDPAFILNTYWTDFWQGDQRAKAQKVLESARLGNVGRMQGYFSTSKGITKWWDVVATPLRDASGQVTTLVVVSRDITEQKQAEEALRESERSLTTLIGNLPGFVFRSLNDPDWTMLFVSEGVQSLTGYPATDFLERTVIWNSLIHPDDLSQVQTDVIKHVEAKIPLRITYRIIDAQNDIRWVRVRSTPVVSETGDVAFWEGFVTDVSDRKEAEMALQLNEERYRLLNSTLSAIIWRSDATGAFTIPQPEWEFYTGQSWEDYKGFGWLQAMHPDDREQVWALWQEAQQRRTTYAAEGRLWHAASSQYRYFEARGMALFDPDGSVREWIGNISDVHDRKQTEAALRDSEERFHDLADNISQFAWMAEANGWIFWYNQRWLDYTGTTIEQMQGWGWQQVQHPAYVNQVVEKFSQCLSKGEIWEDTFPLRGKDGQYRWFLSRAIPVRDAQGNVLRWFGTNTDVTDLLETERALQQTTERLNVALKSAPISLFNQDRELRYTWIYNPSHNYSGDEVLGKQDDDLTSVETATRLTQLKRQVLEQGTTLREVVYVEPNYYDLTIEPLRDHRNAIVGITCAALDISQRMQLEADRREVEEDLRRSEDRLRIALESAQFGTWDWNLMTNELSWDSGCKAMFGLSSDAADITIDTFYEALHPEDKAWVNQVVQSLLEPSSGGSYNIDYRTVGIEDGIERWISAKGHVYFNADGVPQRFSGVVLDISDRKEFEDALMESEAIANARAEELSVLMEAAPAAIWIAHDPHCYRITANQMAQELMGIEPGTIPPGMTLEENDSVPFHGILKGREPLLQELPMQRAIHTQQEVTEELEFVMPDGSVRYIYGKAVPLYNRRGKVRGAIAGFVEITALKQSEKEREELLQRERLAREEAEQANRVKDQFLAVLSHELRSPLNPILGWSKLLQTRKFDEAKTAKALEAIERNARLQAQLVDDLLDLAKILRGKLHLNNAPVDLAFVIEAAMEAVKTAAAAKSISISLNLSPKTQVFGDAARLQQIVWNLLSNAIKFTPSNGQVNVTLSRQGRHAQITVEDTGIGITSDFLPFIFESFRQEDVSITRKHGGLGLGLAIVRQLVDAHGGSVIANSPGEAMGATFTVQLPMPEVKLDDNRPKIVSQTELNLAGIRVLSVDDSADTQEFLTTLLEQYGANVSTASSATEALRMLKTKKPDILISDIGMPDIDGYSLIRLIRALPPKKGGEIPAIALTAYAREDDQQQALASGYQCHLKKPLEPEKLIETLLDLTKALR